MRSEKERSAHRNPRNKHADESPPVSGPAEKQTLTFLTYMGLNLTRKLERSLGNIKNQNSVLSGLIS